MHRKTHEKWVLREADFFLFLSFMLRNWSKKVMYKPHSCILLENIWFTSGLVLRLKRNSRKRGLFGANYRKRRTSYKQSLVTAAW